MEWVNIFEKWVCLQWYIGKPHRKNNTYIYTQFIACWQHNVHHIHTTTGTKTYNKVPWEKHKDSGSLLMMVQF